MRSGVSAPLALTDTGHGIQAFVRRQAGRVSGIGLFAGVAFALASLGTWNVADPSFSHATDSPVTNAMGYPGAVFSDLAMQFFGLSSVAALVPAVIWGFFFATARGVDSLPRRAAAWFGASLLFAAIAGCTTPPETWPLPSGLGGVFGDMVLKIPARSDRRLSHRPFRQRARRSCFSRRRSACSPTARASMPARTALP